jgi:hypothetical protein
MQNKPQYFYELLGSDIASELFLCLECTDERMLVCFDQLSHETWVQAADDSNDGNTDAA